MHLLMDILISWILIPCSNFTEVQRSIGNLDPKSILLARISPLLEQK